MCDICVAHELVGIHVQLTAHGRTPAVPRKISVAAHDYLLRWKIGIITRRAPDREAALWSKSFEEQQLSDYGT